MDTYSESKPTQIGEHHRSAAEAGEVNMWRVKPRLNRIPVANCFVCVLNLDFKLKCFLVFYKMWCVIAASAAARAR